MRSYLVLGVLLSGTLLMAGFAGCSAEKEPQAKSKKNSAPQVKTSAKKTPSPPAEKRTGFAGKWMFQMPAIEREAPWAIWNIDFAKDGRPLITVIDVRKDQQGEKPRLTVRESVKLSDAADQGGPFLDKAESGEKMLVIPVTWDGADWTFRGIFRRGEILGTLQRDDSPGAPPARLVATTESELTVRLLAGDVQPGLRRKAEVANADDKLAMLKSIAKLHANTPAIHHLVGVALNTAAANNADEKTIRSLCDFGIRSADDWGDVARRDVKMRCAEILIKHGHALDYAKTLVDACANEFPEEHVAAVAQVNRLAGLWQVSKIHKLLTSKSDAKSAKAAVVAFEKSVSSRSFSPELTYVKARVAEAEGDKKSAMMLLEQLLAMPGAETEILGTLSILNLDNRYLPQEIHKVLWGRSQTNPTDAAYADALKKACAEMFPKVAYRFAKTAAIPRKVGSRVAVMELFTSGACYPCRSADLAVGGIERTLPIEELIVLRYHQQTAGADPLASRDSEVRFSNYDLDATPTVLFNGAKLGHFGGGPRLAAKRFKSLADAIAAQLGKNSKLKVDLDAKLNGDDIVIKVAATGLPDRTHLVLAIAEREIRYAGSNRILVHEMVVRSMPAGTKGVTSKGGSAKFETTLSRKRLRQRLLDDLNRYETNSGQKYSAKPLDLDDLTVVAFLQVEGTGEILQATHKHLGDGK